MRDELDPLRSLPSEISTEEQERPDFIDGDDLLAGIVIVVSLVLFVTAIFTCIIKLARVRSTEIRVNKETGLIRSREVLSAK